MHWDLFRLKNADEIESVGFWDQFLEREYFVFIEWPERLGSSSLSKIGSQSTKIIQIDFEIGEQEGYRRLS